MSVQALLASLEWQRHMGVEDVLVTCPKDKSLFKEDNFLVKNTILLAEQKQKKSLHGSSCVSEKKVLPSTQALQPDCPESLSERVEKPEKPLMSVSSLPKAALPALQSLSKWQEIARQRADEAKTLLELKEVIETFEGCDLKKTAMNMVFSDGNPQSEVMCIGEAPGADEDRLGKPFVGQSGQLMDKMLASIGLSRENNVYITNIVPWRPPGNRPPTAQEMALCLPFVERHIELVNPKYLLLWGSTAAKTLLKTKETITNLRGRFHEYTSAGLENPISTLVLLHPAYLLRSPGQKRFVWMDLLKFKVSLEHGCL